MLRNPMPCHLEPNRSDPRRYTRYVKYVREGNRVIPYLVTGRSSVRRIEWFAIKPTPATWDECEAWSQHLISQGVRRAS